MSIQIIPVTGLPIIKEGDDLAELTIKSLEEQGLVPKEKDVYVFSHVIASRVEGKQIDLEKIEPSQKAEKYA